MTVYDQFHSLETPELSPPSTTRLPSYFACKVSKHDDSDISSVSSFEEGVDEFDGPLWWDALDGESNAAEAGLHRYKEFLRDQLHKDHSFKEPKAQASLKMAKIGVKTKPLHNDSKVISLPTRQKGKLDHTHIVEEMQDSHDLAGPVEFCFWSMNGQACQCGKC